MIGSHNTMTYLRPRIWAWNLLAGWWRCQDKSLVTQITQGVRWFDLRVAYDKTPGGSLWKWAHGMVDLDTNKDNDIYWALREIGRCQGATCRIMLEKGSEDDEQLFREFFSEARAAQLFPCVTSVVIKNGWKPLWYNKGYLPMTDMSFVPYHRNKPWWMQLRSIITFPFITIKGWAKRHIRPRESDRKNEAWIWVYDFV